MQQVGDGRIAPFMQGTVVWLTRQSLIGTPVSTAALVAMQAEPDILGVVVQEIKPACLGLPLVA